MPKPRNTENFGEEARAVEVARAREGLSRQNEINDLREILKDQKVRDFLWRVMSYGQMFSEAFNNNFGVTGHNLGRAAMAKFVLGEILEADYTAWLVMQQTHYQREAERLRLAEADELSSGDRPTP